ncbi:putative ion channel POLLUX isoform X3 [Curcuma longa]|uniref:putative ion channel POLLUX isoform X3 n=1 Tax=Curcuma longa TaxID=136217 RepID=UPI003D9F0B96
MPTSVGVGDPSYGSDSNPSSTSSSDLGNGGTRPQLKKSRTVTASSSAASSHGSSPPLVRRAATATATLPPPRRLTVAVDNPSDSPANGGVLDRDWFYPSFLGPYAARPRANSRAATAARPATASSGTRKMELPLPLPLPPKRLADRSKVVVSEEVNKELVKRIDERSKNLFSSSSSSSRSPERNFRFDYSFILLILTVICAILAISQQQRVLELEKQITNIKKLCNYDDGITHEKVAVLQLDTNSIDSRTVALYTVVLSLVTPFLLLKCLDHLPHIKSLSKPLNFNEEEVPLKKRIAYRVDVFFSVHPYAKLLALLFATILLIGIGGLALYAVSDASLPEAFWYSWTFVADSGNHADQVGSGPRIVSVSISSGGMLIFAMMLGLVSDAISEKVDSWRKGKSEVIESDHILILGWSDKLGSLLKQLAIANKSIGGGVVVVLAERDKEEMEIDIAKLEFDFMGTSVICRSGSPLILADLKKVSVSKARAIIVLASDANADQSDARALRVVLSLTGVKEGLKGHVVVELSDLDNEPLVKLVGGELIETVVAHDVIGRLMIQCALQPGLAQIWEDILGFENAEFYIKRWPQLDDMRFEDALISFPDAVPCGVKVAANGGKILINPDDSYVLKEGDEILVLAEDDDTYSPGPLPEVQRGFLPNVPNPPKYPEKILFCGWRRDIDDMIMVLEAFLSPGSELWMFNEVPEKEREKKLTDGGIDLSGLTNIRLVHKEGNAVIRRHLESLPLETFDSMSLWRTLLCILIHDLWPPFSLFVIFSPNVFHPKRQSLLCVMLASPTAPGYVRCSKLLTNQ